MAFPTSVVSTDRRDDVVRLLADAPEGLSDGDLARALGDGVRPQTVNTLCRRMVAAGIVERTGTRPIRTRLLGAPASPRRDDVAVPDDTPAENTPAEDTPAEDTPAAGPRPEDTPALRRAPGGEPSPEDAVPGEDPAARKTGPEDTPALRRAPGDEPSPEDAVPPSDEQDLVLGGDTPDRLGVSHPGTRSSESTESTGLAGPAGSAGSAATARPAGSAGPVGPVGPVGLAGPAGLAGSAEAAGSAGKGEPAGEDHHLENGAGRPVRDVLQAWSRTVNVQAAVATWLSRRGATIRSATLDGSSAARDLVARLDGDELHVEITGWPPDSDRTHPTTIAADWFSAAARAAVRRRDAHPHARIVIALPDTRCYRALAVAGHCDLAGARAEVWFVDVTGDVEASGRGR